MSFDTSNIKLYNLDTYTLNQIAHNLLENLIENDLINSKLLKM